MTSTRASASRDSLSLSKKGVPQASSSTVPSLQPIPDRNLEDYVTWSVNRVVTSKKVIKALQEKVSNLEVQLDKNSFQLGSRTGLKDCRTSRYLLSLLSLHNRELQILKRSSQKQKFR